VRRNEEDRGGGWEGVDNVVRRGGGEEVETGMLFSDMLFSNKRLSETMSLSDILKVVLYDTNSADLILDVIL